MYGNYTQEALNNCLNLLNDGIQSVWARINRLTKQMHSHHDLNVKLWRDQLYSIVNEYTMSSRFFLMRRFTNADRLEQAASLSDEDKEALIVCMIEHARGQTGYCSDRDDAVIRKAMEISRNEETTLSRDQAFILGHALRFTLEDMQAFLLKTFEQEAGFRFNSSRDLIEAYVFLIRGEAQRVDALCAAYSAMSRGIAKAMPAADNISWTRDADSSLPEQIASWSNDMDEAVNWHEHLDPASAAAAADAGLDLRDSRFLQWLVERAPHLDAPSHTAAWLYRELVAYACAIVDDPAVAEHENDFIDELNRITAQTGPSSRMTDRLYKHGALSEEQCNKAARMLLAENRAISLGSKPDSAQVWHYPKTVEGAPSPRGGLEDNRFRVHDLLKGNKQVEKPDMLFIVWFIANLCWLYATPNNQIRPSLLSERLGAFLEAADHCLQAAVLPPFYPPHLFERSMMLSIICSGAGLEDPAVIYENMLESLVVPRNRH